MDKNTPGGITVSEHGTIMGDGPQGVNTFRMVSMRSALGLEVKTGMRMSSRYNTSSVVIATLVEAGVLAPGKRPQKRNLYNMLNTYMVSLGYQDAPLS